MLAAQSSESTTHVCLPFVVRQNYFMALMVSHFEKFVEPKNYTKRGTVIPQPNGNGVSVMYQCKSVIRRDIATCPIVIICILKHIFKILLKTHRGTFKRIFLPKHKLSSTLTVQYKTFDDISRLLQLYFKYFTPPPLAGRHAKLFIEQGLPYSIMINII